MSSHEVRHTERTAPLLLKLEQVCERTSLSRPTIYRLQQRGEFPRPVRLSTNRVAWPEHAIDEWIAAKIEASTVDR